MSGKRPSDDMQRQSKRRPGEQLTKDNFEDDDDEPVRLQPEKSCVTTDTETSDVQFTWSGCRLWTQEHGERLMQPPWPGVKSSRSGVVQEGQQLISKPLQLLQQTTPLQGSPWRQHQQIHPQGLQ